MNNIKKISLFSLFLIWFEPSYSQQIANSLDCDIQEYSRIIDDANHLLEIKNYPKAIEKYRAAKVCSPSKAAEVDSLLDKVSNAIILERDEAVAGKLAAKSREVLFKDKDLINAFNIAKTAYCSTEKPTEEAKAALFDILNDMALLKKDTILLYSKKAYLGAKSDKKVYISADGKFAAIINGSEGYSIWDLENFKEIKNTWVSACYVENFSFTHDSKYFILMMCGELILKKAFTGKTIAKVPSNERLRYVYFDERQEELLLADERGTAFLYKLKEKTLDTLSFDKRFLGYWSKGVFSKNKEIFGFAEQNDSLVQIFINNFNENKILKGLNSEVRSLAISSDGNLIAAADYDKIIIWNTLTGQKLVEISGYGLNILRIHFSQSSNLLLAAGLYRKAIIWDVKTGQKLYATDLLNDDIDAEGFTSDTSIVTYTRDGFLKIWKLPFNGSFQIKSNVSFYDIEFSKNKRVMGIGTSASMPFSFGSEYIVEDKVYPIPTGGLNGVYSISFSNNEKLMHCQTDLGKSLIIEVDSQKIIDEYRNKGYHCLEATFSPDNKKIISACDFDGLEVRTINSEKLVDTTLQLNSRGFWSVATLNDWIIAGSSDGAIYILDGYNFKVLQTLFLHKGAIDDIKISQDNRFMVTSSQDKSIAHWDLTTFKVIHHIKNAHEGIIPAVAISADNSLMTSVGRDRLVKVWDTETGIELFRFKGHTDIINAVSFSSNNKELFTGGNDSRLICWHLNWDLFKPNYFYELSPSAKNELSVPNQLFDNLKVYQKHTNTKE